MESTFKAIEPVGYAKMVSIKKREKSELRTSAPFKQEDAKIDQIEELARIVMARGGANLYPIRHWGDVFGPGNTKFTYARRGDSQSSA